MNAQTLPFHEWVIVALLVAIFAVLTLVTTLKNHDVMPPTGAPHHLTAQEIEVEIKGAVAKPGFYTLKKGAIMQDLLNLAEPLPEADLKRIKGTSRLKNDQYVHIPAKETIVIFIDGAVKEKGPITMYKGSALKDLIPQLEFLPNADVQSLNKKRKLKDQEIIEVRGNPLLDK